MLLIFGCILFIDFPMKYGSNNYIKFQYKFYVLFTYSCKMLISEKAVAISKVILNKLK